MGLLFLYRLHVSIHSRRSIDRFCTRLQRRTRRLWKKRLINFAKFHSCVLMSASFINVYRSIGGCRINYARHSGAAIRWYRWRHQCCRRMLRQTLAWRCHFSNIFHLSHSRVLLWRSESAELFRFLWDARWHFLSRGSWQVTHFLLPQTRACFVGKMLFAFYFPYKQKKWYKMLTVDVPRLLRHFFIFPKSVEHTQKNSTNNQFLSAARLQCGKLIHRIESI